MILNSSGSQRQVENGEEINEIMNSQSSEDNENYGPWKCEFNNVKEKAYLIGSINHRSFWNHKRMKLFISCH